MYQIAICDDEAQDLAKIAELAGALLREQGLACGIQTFAAAQELAAARLKGAAWDLILLDIIMEGQDGIELANALRAAGDETDLVFITCSPEYALAGYGSYPVSYLLKPITRKNLGPVLARCLKRREKQPRLVLDGAGGGKVALPLAEIVYIEIFRREVVVHCKSGPVACQGALNAVLERLPAELFYRCHRSFVVNLACVNEIHKYFFELTGGARAPIAMRAYPEARRRWLEFLQ